MEQDSGPSMEELVDKERVDKLDYMGWSLDQGADPKKVKQMNKSEELKKK